MDTPADWELVKRTTQGDMDAFAELVRRHQRHVVHFCLRMAGSLEDAEDLAQESFIRVYRQLGRLSPRAQFSTYLFAAARNLTLNHLRNGRRRGRDRLVPLAAPSGEGDAPLPAARPRPDRAAALHEADALVQDALLRLSPEHREVVVLREIEGMDYDAIAAVVGCRKGTVKSRLARAREQLRKELAPHFGEWKHED